MSVRFARCVVLSVGIALAAMTVGETGIAAAVTIHAMQLPAPPKRPAHEPAAIESFSPYQPQFFCRSTVEPGVKAFEKLTLATYRGTTSDGDMRACGDGGSSEHKDGRAWDWGVDHRIAKQRAAGESMLRWLFATDSHGNSDAMFRRLGLMYVIWNKRIWGAWDQRWQPYSCSGPTLCHVNHMHFSFSWAGAERKTSYWTDRVAGVIEPPLPTLSRLHAHRTLRISAATGSADAMWLLKGGDTYRVTATGVWHDGKGASARVDALCRRTAHGWQAGGGVGISGDNLHSWGQQWTPTADDGSGCNRTTHAYRLTIAPSASSTFAAQLSGSGESRDSGSVVLHVTRTG